MQNAVFLDTVGLLAIWDEADQWHGVADAAYARIIRDRTPVFTSNYVLMECGNAASRRAYRGSVDRLRIGLEARGLVYAPVNAEWRQAWAAYTNAQPGAPGIVDQISFVLMNRLGVTRAFTNDRHFATAGFETLF